MLLDVLAQRKEEPVRTAGKATQAEPRGSAWGWRDADADTDTLPAAPPLSTRLRWDLEQVPDISAARLTQGPSLHCTVRWEEERNRKNLSLGCEYWLGSGLLHNH